MSFCVSNPVVQFRHNGSAGRFPIEGTNELGAASVRSGGSQATQFRAKPFEAELEYRVVQKEFAYGPGIKD